MIHLKYLIINAIYVYFVAAQLSAADQNLTRCVDSASFSAYPEIGRRASIQGTFLISVKFSQEGKVNEFEIKDLTTSRSDALRFFEPYIRAMLTKWQFSVACSPGFRFTLQYKLEEPSVSSNGAGRCPQPFCLPIVTFGVREVLIIDERLRL
jgi:hypothetical protein